MIFCLSRARACARALRPLSPTEKKRGTRLVHGKYMLETPLCAGDVEGQEPLRDSKTVNKCGKRTSAQRTWNSPTVKKSWKRPPCARDVEELAHGDKMLETPRCARDMERLARGEKKLETLRGAEGAQGLAHSEKMVETTRCAGDVEGLAHSEEKVGNDPQRKRRGGTRPR